MEALFAAPTLFPARGRRRNEEGGFRALSHVLQKRFAPLMVVMPPRRILNVTLRERPASFGETPPQEQEQQQPQMLPFGQP